MSFNNPVFLTIFVFVFILLAFYNVALGLRRMREARARNQPVRWYRQLNLLTVLAMPAHPAAIVADPARRRVYVASDDAGMISVNATGGLAALSASIKVADVAVTLATTRMLRFQATLEAYAARPLL